MVHQLLWCSSCSLGQQPQQSSATTRQRCRSSWAAESAVSDMSVFQKQEEIYWHTGPVNFSCFPLDLWKLATLAIDRLDSNRFHWNYFSIREKNRRDGEAWRRWKPDFKSAVLGERWHMSPKSHPWNPCFLPFLVRPAVSPCLSRTALGRSAIRHNIGIEGIGKLWELVLLTDLLNGNIWKPVVWELHILLILLQTILLQHGGVKTLLVRFLCL